MTLLLEMDEFVITLARQTTCAKTTKPPGDSTFFAKIAAYGLGWAIENPNVATWVVEIFCDQCER
jgi:hypothetical protein